MGKLKNLAERHLRLQTVSYGYLLKEIHSFELSCFFFYWKKKTVFELKNRLFNIYFWIHYLKTPYKSDSISLWSKCNQFNILRLFKSILAKFFVLLKSLLKRGQIKQLFKEHFSKGNNSVFTRRTARSLNEIEN